MLAVVEIIRKGIVIIQIRKAIIKIYFILVPQILTGDDILLSILA
jgi:hypothetical protein